MSSAIGLSKESGFILEIELSKENGGSVASGNKDFVIHLYIRYVKIHSTNYIFEFTKTTYNLEWSDYYA